MTTIRLKDGIVHRVFHVTSDNQSGVVAVTTRCDKPVILVRHGRLKNAAEQPATCIECLGGEHPIERMSRQMAQSFTKDMERVKNAQSLRRHRGRRARRGKVRR